MEFGIISEKELIKAYKDKRPKGKWKEVAWGKECTNCKHKFDREIEYICRTDEEGFILPKYCPMCGARILGEVGEE